MQGYKNVFRLEPIQVAIPPGITVAVYVGATAAEVMKTIKYTSGSSLVYIMQDNNGSTMAGATLAANFGLSMGYLIGGTEIINTEGPASFYLAATGATAVMTVMRGFGPTQSY